MTYHRFLATISVVLVGLLTGTTARTVAAPNSSSSQASELVERLNHERRARSLPALAVDARLQAAADAKAEAILATDSFEHTLADGRTPWGFIQATGYRYALAGENLAIDFSDAESIHQAWLQSPTHRQNVLDPAFEHVGIAAVAGEFRGRDTTVVVQLFGAQ